jgi:hypothetical protein
MKQRTFLILLTIAAAAATSSVQAAYQSGDLLVGFTSGTGSSNINDYIFDAGNVSLLYPGETWTLGADVAGTFTDSQFAGASWGVVGVVRSPLSNPTLFASVATPSSFDAGAILTVAANVGALGAHSVAGSGVAVSPTSDNSWYIQTDQSQSAVIDGSDNYFFANFGANPNTPTGANAPLYLYDSQGDPAAWDGSFSISADGNTLTYVPEPGTASLLAGFGLLALSFRRKLNR